MMQQRPCPQVDYPSSNQALSFTFFISMELSKVKIEKVGEDNAGVLWWWKAKASPFPILSTVAHDMLTHRHISYLPSAPLILAWRQEKACCDLKFCRHCRKFFKFKLGLIEIWQRLTGEIQGSKYILNMKKKKASTRCHLNPIIIFWPFADWLPFSNVGKYAIFRFRLHILKPYSAKHPNATKLELDKCRTSGQSLVKH